MHSTKSSTRKLAAIMFTDIVGYTALMGSDRDQAMILVRTNRTLHQELIAKHQGEFLKEMGDGALSSFETALDAVRCAIELQRAANQENGVPLRIGIHLGDITIENGEVYGDGVNVASRLEAMADTGGILISESIEQAIRGQSNIQTVFAGKHQLKNVQYTVRTYAVQGEGLPKLVANNKNKRLIPLVVLAVIGMLAFIIFNWSSSSRSVASEWQGVWDFYYFYDNDSTIQYTGVLTCSGTDSLTTKFEVKLPQGNRYRPLIPKLTSIAKNTMAGELTYQIPVRGGNLKEYFEIRKDEQQRLYGSGRCLEYCAADTEEHAIVWRGQKR